jgi:hypothetical protein
MRVALCFHGLPRLVERCFPDIKKFFLEGNEVDIYAHFWWDKSHQGKVNRLHVNEKNPVGEDPIEIFKRLYKPNEVEFEDCPENIDLSEYPIEGYTNPEAREDSKYSKIMCSFLLYGLYCRFRSAKNVLELVKDKNQYDLVCLIRSDTCLLRQTSLKEETVGIDYKNGVYFPSTMSGGPMYAGEHANRLGDWLFLGDHDNLKTYIDTIISELLNKKNKRGFKSVCISNSSGFHRTKSLMTDINTCETLTPLHNTERMLFWGRAADVNIEIFDSFVSIRRYMVEEWESKKYLRKNKIDPGLYMELFDLEKNKFPESDLLPFYTKNIIFMR